MLSVHRSETATGLVMGLAQVLSETPPDPLAPELVAVPTRGIERWLSQELSTLLLRDNDRADITANIEFPSPRRVLGRALASVRGAEPWSDPWASSQLIWPVLATLDATLDEPWMAIPSWFIHGGTDEPSPGHRAIAAATIARLFARYDVEAPDMIRGWASGTDVNPHGGPLGTSHRWQPMFWRHVREAVGSPSISETLDELIDLIRSEPDRLDLPDRVCFYGFTALAPSYVQTLEAIAAHRDVHLFVLHPSDALWSKGRPETPAAFGASVARRNERIGYAENPLLVSWARDVDELQSVLHSVAIDQELSHDSSRTDEPSLLHLLQQRIRNDTPRSSPPITLSPDDKSLQIHSCHGPSRQVDVARDAILHSLANDPSLEPRDIIIMCPDVETYAPLVEASFHPDRIGGLGIPDIRIRTADRAPTQRNPLAAVLLHLLDVVGQRATASAVIELLKLVPVRTRFRLDNDLIMSLASLIDDAGVAWGIDAEHREDFGLSGRPERTWEDATRRLLVGVFASDRVVGSVGGVVPVSGVEGGDLDMVGRLAELVNRLTWLRQATANRLPASTWRELLLEIADLFGDVDWSDEWQRPALARDIEELLDHPASSGDPLLDRSEIRSLLAPLAATRPSTINHRTGDLTVCTLVPMRSVPHRVICLVGMDDDRFPRSSSRDGDDLLALHPLVGSRDAASEDRQLLLDALMAASEQLIVTYSGRDEHSNMPLPPAVPIAELLEEIDAAATTEAELPASRAVTIEHPLQPFDARNFVRGELIPGTPWGFDSHMLAGARAALSPPFPVPPFVVGSFSLESLDQLPITTLKSFFDHPVKAFCLDRLGVSFQDPDDPRSENLPLELDHLQAWGVGQRLLLGGRDGHDDRDLIAALEGERRLPTGALAGETIASVTDTVDALRAELAALEIPDEPAVSMRVDVVLDEMPRLTGSIGSIHDDCLVSAQYSRVQPKHRLGLYLELLALTATYPDRRWRAHLVGRGGGSSPDVTSLISPDTSPEDRREWACDRLAVLVDLYTRGMAEPIPIFPDCSYRLATGAKYWDIVNVWEDGFYPGEVSDAHHLLAFGRLSYKELAKIPPYEDEVGDGWAESKSRFEVLAHRLWAPVLEMMAEAEEQ